MSKKWTGSLTNRLDENKNFKDNKIIEVGDDVTEYMYSDRHCWYVTKVIDQKHIWIKQYKVVADQTKEGGMGHQNWVYLKDEDTTECELKFRYGKWCIVKRFNRAVYDKLLEDQHGKIDLARMYLHMGHLNDNEIEKVINTDTEIVKYSPFGNISFGIRDYYYDWEF